MKPKSLLRKVAPLALLATVAGLVWLAAVSFGIQFHYVNSGSMEPVIPTHSIVITYKTTDLHRNDVITFHNHDKGILTTHILGGYAKDGTLMTKGAANEDPDNLTSPPRIGDVEGKVWRHIDLLTVIAVAALLLAANLAWPSASDKKEVANRSKQEDEPALTTA